MSETELNKAFLKFKDLGRQEKKFPTDLIANDETNPARKYFA